MDGARVVGQHGSQPQALEPLRALVQVDLPILKMYGKSLLYSVLHQFWI